MYIEIVHFVGRFLVDDPRDLGGHFDLRKKIQLTGFEEITVGLYNWVIAILKMRCS